MTEKQLASCDACLRGSRRVNIAQGVSDRKPLRTRGARSAGSTRRFSSRHVPDVAEAATAHLEQRGSGDVQAAQRLEGLLSHLKRSSTLRIDARWKCALARGPASLGVPGLFGEALRNQFQRFCSLGEQSNLELLPSARWATMLQNAGVLSRLQSPQASNGAGVITPADADVIFQKVLRSHLRTDRRLTYELFCEALLFVAFTAHAELQDEVAFSTLLSRVLAAAPQELRHGVGSDDDAMRFMSHMDVVLALNSWRPRLQQLFMAYSRCNVRNVSGFNTNASPRARVPARQQSPQQRQSPTSADSSPRSSPREKHRERKQSAARPQSPQQRVNAGSPDSSPSSSPSEKHCEAYTKQFIHEAVLSETTSAGSPSKSSLSTDGVAEASSQQLRMSLDQLLHMCREMKLLPDLVSPHEVTGVCRRWAPPPDGVSINQHSGLSFEEFLGAAGHLAMKAYSNPPYHQEYPLPSEKVEAFFKRVLPGPPRAVREQFLYSRSRP